MMRLMIGICLVALLCDCTGCHSNGNSRLDIALEGPWILYEETHFQSNGGKVSVLIAVAPAGASSDQLTVGDLHHHMPQLSTGDGYYIKNPDIYCLTFDGACAPKGPNSLSSDHYPGSSLLMIPFQGANDNSEPWDWAKLGKEGNTVLILPMPDSFSDDGVYPMHFSAKFDPNGISFKQIGGKDGHSIGVHLHYAHGPSKLNLASCVDGATPSISNCSFPASDPVRQLDNSGTLRIQMRAPDNDDGCDQHVRFAYAYVYKLIQSSANQDYAYIEPAMWDPAEKAYGYENAKDHPCLDHDPQPDIHNHSGSSDIHATSSPHGSQTSNLRGRESGTGGNGFSPLPIEGIQEQIQKELDDLKDDEQQNLRFAKNAADKAGQLSGQLDPNFPRISQVLRIGQLLGVSKSYIDRFEDGAAGRLGQSQLQNLDFIKRSAEADAEKGGNDCRAPIVLLQ